MKCKLCIVIMKQAALFCFIIVLFISCEARVTSLSLDNFAPQGWMTTGDAFANSQLVRLVPDKQSRQGGFWSTEPVLFRDWEVVYGMRIHGVSTVGADGLAFWYVRDNAHLGPLFGNEELFTGLGIILDTYDNTNSVSSNLKKKKKENF